MTDDELWPNGPPSPELIEWTAAAVGAYMEANPNDPEVIRFRRSMQELSDGTT